MNSVASGWAQAACALGRATGLALWSSGRGLWGWRTPAVSRASMGGGPGGSPSLTSYRWPGATAGGGQSLSAHGVSLAATKHVTARALSGHVPASVSS